MTFKRSMLTAILVVAGVAGAAGNALADSSMSLPRAQLNFSPSGIEPLEVAPAMGNMMKDGLHGNYVRIPGKFTSPPHSHSEDYFAIVVSGTIANGLPDATDIPLEPGSYWLQKGKEKHVTKCLSDEPCTFFVVQPGKFDFLVN